jgi:CubicO group peptidase (beta-lactamase class C family)
MNTQLLKTFLIAVSLLSFSVRTSAQGLEFVQPEEVGFSSERLDHLESFFSDRVDKGEIAGMVTLVARHGQVAHLSSVGYQDVVEQIPMQDDTLFRIYSMTKPIATTALMMLYQEGRFQLNDPLSKYIPEFSELRVLQSPEGSLDDTVAMEREPTVQDILRHTAGFSHGLGTSEYDEFFVGQGIFSPEASLTEMMTALSRVPLVNQPGSQFRYSVGPDVALRLVEILSGQPANEYLQERIFEPLGMDDTGYVVDSDNVRRFSPIHWSDEGQLVPIDEVYGYPSGGVLVQPWSANSYTVDHEFKGGSYGLVSTAEDYFRFAQTMLNRGELNGNRILGTSIVDFMASNHLTEEQQDTFTPGLGFGLGFAVVENPALVGLPHSVGTFYWGGAAATFFWIDPVEDIVVVSMTQHMAVPETATLRGELVALVYGALID